jgi:hypothetical protein
MNAGPLRAADLAPLVKELQHRADGNHDGQVTSTEFGDFLTGLLQKAGTMAGDAAQAAASASPALSPATLPASALASLRHLTPQYFLAQLLASCPPESSSPSASAVTLKE